MKSLFTRETFRYFDLAKKNKKKKAWFEKNKSFYQDAVREPYALLIEELDRRIGDRLPGVVMSPRKISRPLRPPQKAEEQGWVKAGAMFYLSEKTTSMFEWNPGIYFHLGDEKDDNVIGMGLYGPSSRQIKRLRAAFAKDHASIRKILASRSLKKYWGTVAEEKYKRFPKEYSPEQPGAEYLWYKQFYLRRPFTRREVVRPDFPELVIRAYEAGVPFLTWIRDSIGVYDRREYEREKRERADAEEARREIF